VGKQVGGAMVVKPIMLWLDPFLRHTLTDLFVWPNRIVVPLSPDPNFDYSILEMRCALSPGCDSYVSCTTFSNTHARSCCAMMHESCTLLHPWACSTRQDSCHTS
jgi:hypothetical protein